MSKHTPGPWTVEPPSDQAPHMWITAPTSSGIAKVETCDYDDGRGERLTDEDFANARLIAASPELLAALKEAVEIIEEYSPYDGSRAYSAIAKAEGRS
jgi:hypothetical protein